MIINTIYLENFFLKLSSSLTIQKKKQRFRRFPALLCFIKELSLPPCSRLHSFWITFQWLDHGLRTMPICYFFACYLLFLGMANAKFSTQNTIKDLISPPSCSLIYLKHLRIVKNDDVQWLFIFFFTSISLQITWEYGIEMGWCKCNGLER